MNRNDAEVLREMVALRSVRWANPAIAPFVDGRERLGFSFLDAIDASDRLDRFRPLLKALFADVPDGIVESPLTPIPAFQKAAEQEFDCKVTGQLLLKRDSELPIAGSVKARGGVYEVLCVAERLAKQHGLLREAKGKSTAVLADETHRRFFSQHRIVVGSTGNLGLSVGMMAAALGFRAQVHMSQDAKQWKKDLLRKRGAQVVEHADDYGKAVAAGRASCAADPSAHFVDDEQSHDLFLGYSVAALRLKPQLEALGIGVDGKCTLHVHLPCGVGGAPCGIAFGLKQVFGDTVRCRIVEPTHAPCMLLALITGDPSRHVRDYGIDGMTEADGLAVGIPSALAFDVAKHIVSGGVTVDDDDLFRLLALLYDKEGLKIEPSAAAGLYAALKTPVRESDVQIAWATGGSLLPDCEFEHMLNRGRQYLSKR